MIILSKLADYGVIVATHLAASASVENGVAVENAASIAQATRLPQATVSKVLKALARAGIVTGTRGAAGGYRLAGAASGISVAAVIAAIDGDIGITQCAVHEGGQHPAECERSQFCSTRPHWQSINRAVGAALSAISLAEMRTPQIFSPTAPTRVAPATLVSQENPA